MSQYQETTTRTDRDSRVVREDMEMAYNIRRGLKEQWEADELENNNHLAGWPYNHLTASVICGDSGEGETNEEDPSKVPSRQTNLGGQNRRLVDLDDEPYPSDEESQQSIDSVGIEKQMRIEVTEDEYRQTIGFNTDQYARGKISSKTMKKMKKRVDHMLSFKKKKFLGRTSSSQIGQSMRYASYRKEEQALTPLLRRPQPSKPVEKTNETMTKLNQKETSSDQCQQSVANKTVDSFASTIKASNRALTNEEHEAAAVEPGTKKKDKRISSTGYRDKPTKSWKALKRFIHGAGSENNLSDSDVRNGCIDFAGSDRLKSTYQMRHGIRSEDIASSRRKKYTFTRGIKSKSWGARPWRRRASSAGEDDIINSTGPEQFNLSKTKGERIDTAILGRRDGTDILSLGAVCRSTLRDIRLSSNLPGNLLHIKSFSGNDGLSCANPTSSGKHFQAEVINPLKVSFTDLQSEVGPSDLVSDMIWNSGGTGRPEIVLEGFFPGSDDRWTIHLDAVSSAPSVGLSSHSSAPTLKPASTSDDPLSSDASSFYLPSNQLWSQMWGSNASPPPTHEFVNSSEEALIVGRNASDVGDEDLQLTLAGSCNVPVDLDDDTFIIGSPKHFYAVHEMIMPVIQRRSFGNAIKLFNKLLRGLEGGNNEELNHAQWMIAATHHNIGMMELCRANYEDALQSFERSVSIREQSLPRHHPDLAVSLTRCGIAYFALHRFQEARRSFQAAIRIHTNDDPTKAKILCNLAVVDYQLEDYNKAIKTLMKALEIQRGWLDGPVQREVLVYDTAVTLSNMGKCYLQKSDYDLACFVWDEALSLQTSGNRRKHQTIFWTAQDNVSRLKTLIGKHAEALQVLSDLAESQQTYSGMDSELYIETIGIKGFNHFKLLELEEANRCLKEVHDWQIQHLGRFHSNSRLTNDLLIQIRACLKGDEPMWL